MFVIVEIAGKQFKVSKGDILEVPKLKNNQEGDKVKLETVLLRWENETPQVGRPYVEGALVQMKVLSHEKAEKIRIFKKKSKKRYERTQGHRQQYTKVEVIEVN